MRKYCLLLLGICLPFVAEAKSKDDDSKLFKAEFFENLDKVQMPMKTKQFTEIKYNKLAVTIAFQRYLYGLLHGNIDLVLSVTANKIDIPCYDKGLTKMMQKEFFSEFFATYDITKVTPSEIYNFDTAKVIVFGKGTRHAIITIFSQKRPPKPLKNWHYWEDFWNLQHHYFFEKINNQWKLIAFDIAYDSGV